MAAALIKSYFDGGIVAILLSTTVPAPNKVSALRDLFARFGPAAPLAYVLFVILEVIVAPIPGTLLYAPGGVIFGGFQGGLLSLTGNVIGAGISCLLMRTILGTSTRDSLLGPRLDAYEARIKRHGMWVIFLLRVSPITSSDLVSYAAGLTRLPVWKVMLGTGAGMAPLCFLQAYAAGRLLSDFPSLMYLFVAACATYAAAVIWIVCVLVSRQGAKSAEIRTG
jgi:uncharacterized membrane protein YdjX (TVP38/TMEM64 family)